MATAKKAMKKSRKIVQRRSTGDPHLVKVEYRLRFKTADPVSVEAAIASLRGMDRIVKHQLPKAIYNVTGARVRIAELQVSGLEDGSFIEDLMILLLFKSKKDYEKFVKKTADAVKSASDGGTPMLRYAIGALIGALIVGGLGLLPSRQSQPTQTGALSNIQGDNNAVILIGAEAYKESPAEFQKAVDSAIGKTSVKRTAQAALDATAPAREQGVGVESEADGQAIPIISASTARELPKEITPADTSEDVGYTKLKLRLRAMDFDSATKGWAGTLPGYIEQRTRVIFTDPAEMAKAINHAEVEADVTVTYSTAAHTRAILIMVEKIY
jgi:hypothetical protein